MYASIRPTEFPMALALFCAEALMTNKNREVISNINFMFGVLVVLILKIIYYCKRELIFRANSLCAVMAAFSN
jgi:hypothetical protein